MSLGRPGEAVLGLPSTICLHGSLLHPASSTQPPPLLPPCPQAAPHPAPGLGGGTAVCTPGAWGACPTCLLLAEPIYTRPQKILRPSSVKTEQPGATGLPARANGCDASRGSVETSTPEEIKEIPLRVQSKVKILCARRVAFPPIVELF